MFFKNLAKVSSSLHAMIKLSWLDFVGGFCNKWDIASLIRVLPSSRFNPYNESKSESLLLETLCTSAKVSSEILSPIVFVLPRLLTSLNNIPRTEPPISFYVNNF